MMQVLSSLCCLLATSRLAIKNTTVARRKGVAGQLFLPVAACRLGITFLVWLKHII